MLAYKRGVNEWAREIKLIFSIFLIIIFEASSIMAQTIHLFDRGNYIIIMFD